jgi:hypothetical protein
MSILLYKDQHIVTTYTIIMQVDTKSRQVEIEMESAELRSDQAPSMPLKQETQG